MLEKFSMEAVLNKLAAIGGNGKFQEKDWRIRCRLNWHTKAKSAVRHMLSGARKIEPEEIKDIEEGFIKHFPEMVEAHRAANRQLFDQMRTEVARLEAGDVEFHKPQIEAMRSVLLQLGNMVGQNGIED